ncbi:extracellular solute-binding protein [Polycladidibacter hongkongensis]|uniref:extracellular solute-binding protein n=1 Tax=Polycladidibacter hongkongensis TaxID=1647556 RepID=UPI00082E898F|nr:extracellular solute-binding protein [Pseudovibrio hongkongensis]
MNQENKAADWSRRSVLKLGATGLGLAALPATLSSAIAKQAGQGRVHGLSVFGDLAYAAGFQAFNYVNPAAPKGGQITLTASSWQLNQNPQTFNSFNSFILKGDAPPRMEMCFDSLMVRALDEPDAMYGLVAKSVDVSHDGNFFVFKLREEARFHDGSFLRAEDVAYSISLLKEHGHPILRQTLQELVSATAPADDTLTVAFTGKHSPQLPLIVAGLPIFSKAYYSRYDFTSTTLTPPLSSGPYKVGPHQVGRYVEYDRQKDYWAKDLPVVRGHFNFDKVRIDFFRESQAAFEAFKKGAVSFREENSSQKWATGYDFPAVKNGSIKRHSFPDNRPAGAQGWFFNTRLAKFSDPRVRQAISLAFDFEWSNNALFYGLYTRTQGFFANSPMQAEGLPSVAELALLDPYKDQLPQQVFDQAYIQPVSNGSGQDRGNLAKAAKLLKQAGLQREGAKLIDKEGKPFSFEFLSNSQMFERITAPFIKNLELLGISASFRVVDPAQYEQRLNNFEFDVVSRRFALTPTLGDDAYALWGSASAERPGSYNMAGINSPVVDALIEHAVSADTREKQQVAARALDRVLRLGFYWVPQWYKPVHTVAYWDKFGIPKEVSLYDFPVETTWWQDPDKTKELEAAN